MFAWPLPGAGYRTWLTVAAPMTQRLSPGTAAMLAAAPLLWAGNAVVGRALHTLIAPSTLNFLRWLLAFALLLPLAWQVLRPASGLWPHWRRYAALGLFGIGSYNALQYLALQTSTALNVTLVGSGMPVWMLVVGALFFGVPVTRRQAVGALLSVTGVVLVLSRGSVGELLALRLVPGDLYMVLATISWAFYSWLLSRTSEPTSILGRSSCQSGRDNTARISRAAVPMTFMSSATATPMTRVTTAFTAQKAILRNRPDEFVR